MPRPQPNLFGTRFTPQFGTQRLRDVVAQVPGGVSTGLFDEEFRQYDLQRQAEDLSLQKQQADVERLNIANRLAPTKEERLQQQFLARTFVQGQQAQIRSSKQAIAQQRADLAGQKFEADKRWRSAKHAMQERDRQWRRGRDFRLELRQLHGLGLEFRSDANRALRERQSAMRALETLDPNSSEYSQVQNTINDLTGQYQTLMERAGLIEKDLEPYQDQLVPQEPGGTLPGPQFAPASVPGGGAQQAPFPQTHSSQEADLLYRMISSRQGQFLLGLAERGNPVAREFLKRHQIDSTRISRALSENSSNRL